MKRGIIVNTLMVTSLTAANAWAGERKDADITCKPTDTKLVYNCMISLTGKKTGMPIEGAEFMVGAEMPSMAGAHNVKPVHAKPQDTPGMYSASVRLEMFGEWAITLHLKRPNRDRVVKKLRFESEESHAEHKHSSSMDDTANGQMKKMDLSKD
ncbi:MAG: FixH family protein [Alphaproteobacteria bacterium]|nr:FixH family protein [Alphaproteobacteria bacterium]